MKKYSFHIHHAFIALMLFTVLAVSACTQGGLSAQEVAEGKQKIIVIEKSPVPVESPAETQPTQQPLEPFVEEVATLDTVEPITEEFLRTSTPSIDTPAIYPSSQEPQQKLYDPVAIHQSLLPNINNNACPQDDSAAYRLGAEDEFLITVFGEGDLSGKFKIQNTGSVTLPLIGEITLSGCTIKQAESILFSKYSDGYLINPSIALTVSQYRPYYIIGEVKEPGRYDYVVDMNILQAVALAGGYTYRANKNTAKVLINHENGEAVYEQKPITEKVRPGDVIFIRERFF